MNGIAIFTVLVAVGAPVPAKPAQSAVDPGQARIFARMVYQLALQVKERSVKEGVTDNDLFAGAIQGLYDEIGSPVPDSIKEEVRAAKSWVELVELLTAVRIQLGNHPNLAGSRSLIAAINGFRHATDPLSVLVSPRTNVFASGDQDFGIGIELEGVSGNRWTIYQTEYGIASGRFAPLGYFGAVPKPEDIPSPALLPWRVKRVVPGSHAQKGGVKPGDRVIQIDGIAINADNANRVFAALASPRFIIDPLTGLPATQDRVFVFQRENGKPFEVATKNSAYSTESAFGVIRETDEKWDCMLDREAKIGYIRIGPIELGLEAKVGEMMADLVKQGCRGLILDLRWCPGGYVDPGTRIAGLFLKEGSVIAKMQYRNYQAGNSGNLYTPPGSGMYVDIPLVLLVGQETTGGGELIASALRDNNRCVVVGQRTVGRASIQSTIDNVGFGGLQFKLTTGTSLRPNGKSRQRLPNSQPTDDWGIRPDDGLEVPVTLDKSMELHQEADLQALRPANNYQALPFDDPTLDPYRLAALNHLRKKLGVGK